MKGVEPTLPAVPSGEAPAPGEIIGGKYRVERLVGKGGMAIVMEAMHLELDERVALKFLNRDALKSEDLVSRFQREARASAKLKSEHVAKVYDVGARPDGSPYIVMEYLAGHDLSTEVAKGPIPIEDAVEYVIQACEAISEAHYRGIVHRDLKPENLFLVDRPGGRFVKVLDFGISKVALSGRTSSVAMEQTGTQRIMGSPYYMSPEQLRSSRGVDGRTDIWSLGAVLFELLTGVRAFADADDFSALVITIVQDRHRSMLDYVSSMPMGLIEIVDRCLAKNRDDRFDSAASLAIALLPFAPERARPVAERAVALAESTNASLRVSRSYKSSLSPSGSRRREKNGTEPGIAVSNPRMSAEAIRSRGARAKDHRVVAYAAAGVAVLAVGISLARRPEPAAPAPVVAAAPAPPPTDLQIPRTELARLVVRATPEGARIFIDGAETQGNPYTATFRRDGVTHLVRVEAKDFDPLTRAFVASGDSTIDVSLAAHAAAPAAPPAVPPRRAPAPRAAAPAPPPPATTTPAAAPAAAPAHPKIDGSDPYAK
ncbi:MAG TPA: serine/threonine-protein kinase [Polyangiaceae bacterium]|jgi:serine/threonine-protein kinase